MLRKCLAAATILAALLFSALGCAARTSLVTPSSSPTIAPALATSSTVTATPAPSLRAPAADEGCGAHPSAVAGLPHARVVRVIDGDTIVLEDGQRVRYIGVDTPELSDGVEFLAHEAREANRGFVEGRIVSLEKDYSETDRFGRLLRYVYVDSTFVNAELVRMGYAEAKAYPPDIRYQSCLGALEREARAAGMGIWVGR